MMNWTVMDSWIVFTGVVCAVACAVPGNFLVLRKMSMMGDAISHAVLPGLAIAFLITGSRGSIPMLMGAGIVGIATAVLVTLLSRYGRLDEGSSMGVVFTTFFAMGLVLIARTADRVDLDPGCVLYGAIELAPLDTTTIAGIGFPKASINAAIMLLINLIVLIVFYKEMKMSSFDPAFAESSGLRTGLLHLGLMSLVAATCVAAFESVGSILVIAMLVVPAATARLLTERLGWMMVLSAILAAAAAVLGHIGAIVVPGWFGMPSTTTAGMMAVATGVLFVGAVFLSPSQGLIARAFRQARLSVRIQDEDLLARMFRAQERGESNPEVPIGFPGTRAARRLVRAGLAAKSGELLKLTTNGMERARELVRKHRLWESYMVDSLGRPADRVHRAAERLEHFTTNPEGLAEEAGSPDRDPHRREIP